MLARSQQSPVIAQRPIAPLRPVQSEEKRVIPMEMISVTDAGAESVTIDEDTNEISTPVQRSISIEEMAYGTGKSSTKNRNSGFALNQLANVSAPNPVGEVLHELWKRTSSVVLKNPDRS